MEGAIVDEFTIKNVVLHDFNTDYWRKFDLNNIQELIDEYLLKEKSTRLGQLGHGEEVIGHMDIYKVTHFIDHCFWDPINKMIMGDVSFLKETISIPIGFEDGTMSYSQTVELLPNSKIAKNLLSLGTVKFSMFSTGELSIGKITEILTFNIIIK